MNKHLNIFFVLCAMVLFSCQKEESTFETTQPSTTTSVELSGIVNDINENPIVGAVVYYNGQTTTTNENGIYSFETVDVNSRHNTIQITKDGFFEGGRTFRTLTQKFLIHETVLLEKSFDQSFQSSEGGIVSDANVDVTFDAQSIIFEEDGNDYIGLVDVAFHYLNPMDENLDKKMPGDLTGIDTENILLKTTSFGMVYVELKSPTGDPLQIKEGSSAQIKIKVPDELRGLASDKIDASVFDEELGLWKTEAEATFDGTYYTAQVPHFSCWNFNANSPSVIVTGRILNSVGQPISGMHVQISEPTSGLGGFGYTDAEGVFTGAVAKDVPLNLYVSGPVYCTGFPILRLNESIGSLSVDTDLGDRTIDDDGLQFIDVEASFYNCQDLPVTNGLVRIARSYFKLDGNPLSVTVPVCASGGNYFLMATDLDTDKITPNLPLDLDGENDFTNTSICEITAPFLTVVSEELGLDERAEFELIANGFNGENKSLFAIWVQDGDNTQIEMDYVDGNMNGFNTGSFAIQGGGISELGFPNVELYSITEGVVNVSYIDTDDIGEYMVGGYSLNVETNTGMISAVNGEFKLYLAY